MLRVLVALSYTSELCLGNRCQIIQITLEGACLHFTEASEEIHYNPKAGYPLVLEKFHCIGLRRIREECSLP